MREPVIIGDCTLYLGDCREVLPTLGRTHLVFTSPPYDQQRQYGLGQFNWRQMVCVALGKITDDRAQVLVNLGLIHRNGEVNQYWRALFSEMEERGWRLFGWYVWDKGFGAPGDWNGRFAPAHEFVFHFNKEPRQPAKWVPTLGYKHVGKGMRRSDGSLTGVCSPDLVGQAFKIPDSVIRVTPQQSRVGPEREHPAVFPVELAEHAILSFSDVGDVVCDPFLGSGTTLVACAKLGRRGIGIEINPQYFDIACRRIEEATRQADLFIAPEKRPEPVQTSLLDEAAA